MMKQISFLLFVFTTISLVSCSSSEELERPCIWVRQSDRAQILAKIENQPWAKEYYAAFVERVRPDLEAHQDDPDAYLRKLPIDWDNQKTGQSPPLVTGNWRDNTLQHYLQTAIDCGVIYFLEEEEKYAQYSLDVLNAFVLAIVQLEPALDTEIGGWLYPTNNLKESRKVGPQVPIIYDFVVPYIKEGAKAYNLGSRSYTEFPLDKAQEVFRTYATLTIEQGIVGCNWPVLESPQLVHNALALEDEEERNKYLRYYLTESTNHQDALNKVAEPFQKEGDVHPESSQYSNAVAVYSTRLMYLLTRFDPSLHLGQKYPNIPLSLDRWTYFKYPNEEIVRFGDGWRHLDVEFDVKNYEFAYCLGELDNVPALVDKFGPLLKTAMAEGKYNRGKLGDRPYGTYVHYDAAPLLWFSDELQGEAETIALPRTNAMPHAGLYLQRNCPPGTAAKDGLMCFVGGSHHVHGHASGMNIELYGKGEVLGVDQGRKNYRRDIHENYTRLFAAHNTVIVNGSSRSDSGWVNLGINTVQKIAMEPLPFVEAVSPDHSFSRTSFADDRGELAEAVQERTLALIRTSPSSGYYVDVFRSKSKLEDEFHDYLYHNIGDELVFKNPDLVLKKDSGRFMANANDPWVQNTTYRHPGWHFFEQVEASSLYSSPLQAQFRTEKIPGKRLYMNLFIPGGEGREYSRVMAPRTYEAPSPYEGLPTPTLVIRQNGEAWTRPFVVVFEPAEGSPENGTIQSVEAIRQDGVYKGVKVISKMEDRTIIQYILTQSTGQVFRDDQSGIYFQGGFAVITTDQNSQVLSMYMGDGRKLQFGEKIMESTDGKDMGVYLDFSGESARNKKQP